MKFRTTLIASFSLLMFMAMIAFGATGYFAGKAAVREQPLMAYTTIAVFVFLFTVTAVVLVSIHVSRRLERLVFHTKHAASVLKQPEIGSRDEIDELERIINEILQETARGEQHRYQLIADTAHELKTPVAILRGHMETMLAGAEELAVENLLPLVEETKRMSKLLQDLQQLVLAEAGQLNLERQWVHCSSLLGEIVSILETEAEDKGISVSFMSEFEGEIYCDPHRFKQVLINIVGNAIRYTPSGSMIEVNLTGTGGHVCIEVRDNGPGIPPEDLPYIFKRFYRVEESRTRRSGGTGLGLAIAKQYMEAHGGTLAVTSEVGKGTTFKLELPLFPLT